MFSKVTDSVLYVGAFDNTLDLFEAQYPIHEGVSYNSYVIDDDKIAIMDTADKRVASQWLENVTEALDGRKPDYLVISHMEPDHSACIKTLANRYPDMKLVGNQKTFVMLSRYFEGGLPNETVMVKEGDELSLGYHVLTFVMAPMVHWPEVMMIYDKTENILFSADGFGRFGPLEDYDWACEARRYYFNIVGKYGAQVQAVLKKAAGLDIKIICPLHGPVLLENLGYYLGLYNTWSSYEPENSGILVAYCSVHGNTAEAAQLLAKELDDGKTTVSVMDLCRCDLAEALEDAFRYDRMVIAAPTLDGGIFPKMVDFLLHLKSKNYQKRTIGIIENGSWAPMAGKLMAKMVSEMKNITVLEPIVTVNSALDSKSRESISNLAKALLDV